MEKQLGVLDFEYDPQLVLIEFVFDVASGVIDNRIESIQTGEDTSVDLIPGFFDKLLVLLNELAVTLEEDQDTYKTLEGIIELAHITTRGASRLVPYRLTSKEAIKKDEGGRRFI